MVEGVSHGQVYQWTKICHSPSSKARDTILLTPLAHLLVLLALLIILHILINLMTVDMRKFPLSKRHHLKASNFICRGWWLKYNQSIR